MSITPDLPHETKGDRAKRIAEATADAYSHDAFGDREWLRSTHMLIDMGYTDEEVEAILRSKWTRWARDEEGTYKGSCRMLRRFILQHADRPGYEVRDLL